MANEPPNRPDDARNPDHDDEPGGRGPPPEVAFEQLDPDAVAALRSSLADDERERVEGTVTELFDLFGRAYAMAILREFAVTTESLRFRDLEASIGAPPSTLSARLDDLVAAGLLDRRSYEEVPPRVEYEPTATARALFPAFGYLHWWAMEHELEV